MWWGRVGKVDIFFLLDCGVDEIEWKYKEKSFSVSRSYEERRRNDKKVVRRR